MKNQTNEVAYVGSIRMEPTGEEDDVLLYSSYIRVTDRVDSVKGRLIVCENMLRFLSAVAFPDDVMLQCDIDSIQQVVQENYSILLFDGTLDRVIQILEQEAAILRMLTTDSELNEESTGGIAQRQSTIGKKSKVTQKIGFQLSNQN